MVELTNGRGGSREGGESQWSTVGNGSVTADGNPPGVEGGTYKCPMCIATSY